MTNMGAPRKRTIHFTDQVLADLPSHPHPGKTVWDAEVGVLAAQKSDNHNGKVAMVVHYGSEYRLVLNGKARTREQIGLWPDMTIEQARDIARGRKLMWEDQKLNPIKAPPLRRSKSGKWEAALARMPSRPDEVPEEILNPGKFSLSEDRYESLAVVMMEAVARASETKGKARHEDGANFENQPMARVMDRVGDGFALGQAIKKIVESQKMSWERARQERLDAMVYIAGSILWKDAGKKK